MPKAPFPGPLGEEVQKHVSVEGFQQWQEMQVKIINEYRLDLSEPKHRQVLLKQMRQFLGLDAEDEGAILEVGNPTHDHSHHGGGCC